MKYKKIASERIEILMQRAEEAFAQDKKRANRYAELARKIGMRYNLRLPKKWKRRICKKCLTFLKPGSNCRVRIYKGRVIITCLECKNVVRIPYRKVVRKSAALPQGRRHTNQLPIGSLANAKEE